MAKKVLYWLISRALIALFYGTNARIFPVYMRLSLGRQAHDVAFFYQSCYAETSHVGALLTSGRL